ncbi:hypothetical protein QFZ91_005067 [Paraburkholderia sp. JPY419]
MVAARESETESGITMKATGPRRLLVDSIGPVAAISLAQLFGTALWFSANGTAADLMKLWHASAADIGWLTNAVQLGFILGTLIIALSGAADRFRASSIFVCSALAGAILNLCFAWFSTGLVSGGVYRFGVGVCLAGIYPMGMKLIVGWALDRTGQALAQLVAMLVLGTALPHAMRVMGTGFPWQLIISASSVLAVGGAIVIGVLGEGPHSEIRVRAFDGGVAAGASQSSVIDAFRIPSFRAATFGYFGHMWELHLLDCRAAARLPFISRNAFSRYRRASDVVRDHRYGCGRFAGGRCAVATHREREGGDRRTRDIGLLLSDLCARLALPVS